MIAVSQTIPDWGKSIALAVEAALQEAANKAANKAGSDVRQPEPSEYKFDASAWNDPKYYPAYAAKEEGDAE